MNNDDRDYYRTKSDSELVRIANEQAMTVELGIVLAERLDAVIDANYTITYSLKEQLT